MVADDIDLEELLQAGNSGYQSANGDEDPVEQLVNMYQWDTLFPHDEENNQPQSSEAIFNIWYIWHSVIKQP